MEIVFAIDSLDQQKFRLFGMLLDRLPMYFDKGESYDALGLVLEAQEQATHTKISLFKACLNRLF